MIKSTDPRRLKLTKQNVQTAIDICLQQLRGSKQYKKGSLEELVKLDQMTRIQCMRMAITNLLTVRGVNYIWNKNKFVINVNGKHYECMLSYGSRLGMVEHWEEFIKTVNLIIPKNNTRLMSIEEDLFFILNCDIDSEARKDALEKILARDKVKGFEGGNVIGLYEDYKFSDYQSNIYMIAWTDKNNLISELRQVPITNRSFIGKKGGQRVEYWVCNAVRLTSPEKILDFLKS